MRRSNFFDLLPVELLHTLFTYFLAHEILLSFYNVSDHMNAVLVAYSAYRVNFKFIRKTDFDLICRHICPNQIISLKLSDDQYTPGLSELFFSRFRIEQFTRLQSLTLIEIEFESMESIFYNLYQLNQLRSLSFNDTLIRKKYPTRTDQYLNLSNQINLLLFDTYTHVLPHLTHVYLNSGDVFKPIPLPHLYHLKLNKCTPDELEIIFQNAPQLRSLHICLELKTPGIDISLTSSQLTRLNLEILGE